MAVTVDKDFLKEVGLRIKKIRIKKKMSQSELAIRIESHRSLIRSIENGKSNTGIHTYKVISEVLGIDDANEILPLKQYNPQK